MSMCFYIKNDNISLNQKYELNKKKFFFKYMYNVSNSEFKNNK